MLAVAIVLLVLSNRTGKEQYDVENRDLDRIEAVNARLDAAVLALRFQFHTDFDLMTDLERDLHLASAALTLSADAAFGSEHGGLGRSEGRAARGVQGAARRRPQLDRDLRGDDDRALGDEARLPDLQRTPETLLKVERALLHYIVDGRLCIGPPARGRAETAEGVRPISRPSSEWRLLSAHVDNLLSRRVDLEVLLNDLFAITVPQAVEAERPSPTPLRVLRGRRGPLSRRVVRRRRAAARVQRMEGRASRRLRRAHRARQ